MIICSIIGIKLTYDYYHSIDYMIKSAQETTYELNHFMFKQAHHDEIEYRRHMQQAIKEE